MASAAQGQSRNWRPLEQALQNGLRPSRKWHPALAFRFRLVPPCYTPRPNDLIFQSAVYSMTSHIRIRRLAFLFSTGILALCTYSDLAAQEKSSSKRQPSVSKGFPKPRQPLILKLEGIGQKYRASFESELTPLDRELREILGEMNRKGMD